jgi:cytochrome d ubiquinol oxidase subunit II
MDFDLPLLWAGIIAFGVLMYVVLDGFDLGIGLLFPLLPDRRSRDVMMNSVAPVWDGNETWLVLGGAGLFGAFPLAYAVILPALYLPLTMMLIGLIFRGVAFEFRFKASDRGRRWWDLAFACGSALAALMQGVALGAFIQGFTVENRAFAWGPFDWMTPFALFVGVALVLGYALLGAARLVMKTEGELQQRIWRLLWPITFLVLASIAGVSFWTPFLDEAIYQRWFAWPNLLYLSPVPILVAVIALFLLRAEKQQRDRQPFFLALGLFALAYGGLAISLWPNVIPPHIDIWEASAPEESQSFLIVGVVPMVVIILAYTAYSYWVFRGKVGDEGYH